MTQKTCKEIDINKTNEVKNRFITRLRKKKYKEAKKGKSVKESKHRCKNGEVKEVKDKRKEIDKKNIFS